MSETINRDEVLRELERLEDELERIEARCQPLRDKLKQTDERGRGVMVSYDYDLKWIVETLNDGEWELYNVLGYARFSDAVRDARQLKKELNCGLEIHPYKPKPERVA